MWADPKNVFKIAISLCENPFAKMITNELMYEQSGYRTNDSGSSYP